MALARNTGAATASRPIVNYQILGRVLLKWFDPSDAKGPDPWFGLLTHLGFGLLLVPFFLAAVFRYGQAPAAHAAGGGVEDRQRAMPTGR